MSRLYLMFTPAVEETPIHSLKTTNKQKRRFRQMLLRIFSPRTKPLARRSEARLRDRARTMSMLSVWSTKDTTDGSDGIIDAPPPSLSLIADTFQFSVTCPEEDEEDFRRDSKFSSFASLQDSCFSVSSDAPSSVSSVSSTDSLPIVVLDEKSLKKLQSLARRAIRGLKEQEYLTGALSGNLAACLARKENDAYFNLRLSIEWRVQIAEICQMLRKLVGRMFMQKMVSAQRNMQLVQSITEQLAQVEWNEEGTTKLDVDGIQAIISTMKENLTSQATIDMDLRNYVAPPCEDMRLPATAVERAALKRFVAFMDERFARLGISYDRTTSLVEEIEGIVMGLQSVRE